MHIAWTTDPHFDHCDETVRDAFLKNLNSVKPDIVLLGGDFSQANCLEKYIKLIENNVNAPVFSVLGNHDYYFGSIKEIREKISSSKLNYLPSQGIVPLTNDTALIGHDCWGDARNGNLKSTIDMNDFLAIKDLKHLYPRTFLFDCLKRLGDEAAEYLADIIPTAFESFRRLIVLTHVPPFVETCLYNGKPSGEDYLPFFSCYAVGRLLKLEMLSRPDKEMLVLSGHTHSQAEARILPNLLSKVGGGDYGQPITDVFDI